MPVSLTPIALTVFSVILIIVGWPFSAKKWRLKNGIMFLGGALLLLTPPTVLTVAGVVFRWQASFGSADSQYYCARWIESAPEQLSSISIIPYSYNFSESWTWLEKAAANGSVDAKYAIGNRLKYSMFIPPDADRSRDSLLMMEEAISDGFILRVPAHQFYFLQFRIKPLL